MEYTRSKIKDVGKKKSLIWVGFLGVPFEEGTGGGGKINLTPFLKFVRIMLKT